MRIRVYGLISLTRRGYLTLLVLELILLAALAALVIYWLRMPHPPAATSAERDLPHQLAQRWQGFLPWVFVAALFLAAIEAFVILRRFARAESLVRNQPDDAPRG